MPHISEINRLILIASSPLIGCASNKYANDLKAAQLDVHMLSTGQTEVCDVIKQCRYIKNLRCYTRLSPNHIQKCELSMLHKTAQAGGDTFIFQLRENNKRYKTHTSYGQAYDCKDVSKRSVLSPAHNKVRLFNHETIDQCGLPSSCKPLTNLKCTTRRPKLVVRCVNKIRAKTERYYGDAFVIKESYFYAKLRKYKLTGQSYVCNQ